MKISSLQQGYIYWPFPSPPGGEEFRPDLKNREEFDGGLQKKRKRKKRKKGKKEKKGEKGKKGKK